MAMTVGEGWYNDPRQSYLRGKNNVQWDDVGVDDQTGVRQFAVNAPNLPSAPLGGLQHAVAGLGGRGGGGAAGGVMPPADIVGRIFDNRSVEGGVAEMRRLGLMGAAPDPEVADLRNQAQRVQLRQAARLPHEIAGQANDMADRQAQGAGNRYYMPEVAGPRHDAEASKLNQIMQQYIMPAQIRGQADMYGADQSRTAAEERAAAELETAELAAETGRGNTRARDTQTMGSVVGELGKLGEPNDQQKQSLAGLLQALMARFGGGR